MSTCTPTPRAAFQLASQQPPNSAVYKSWVRLGDAVKKTCVSWPNKPKHMDKCTFTTKHVNVVPAVAVSVVRRCRLTLA